VSLEITAKILDVGARLLGEQDLKGADISLMGLVRNRDLSVNSH
jgi:hypothetical protein